MTRTVKVVFPEQLVADVNPLLIRGKMNLRDYVLEAVTWYTDYLRWEPKQKAGWTDMNVGEQEGLLRQVHKELAPYTMETLQEALAEDEDWEALLA